MSDVVTSIREDWILIFCFSLYSLNLGLHTQRNSCLVPAYSLVRACPGWSLSDCFKIWNIDKLPWRNDLVSLCFSLEWCPLVINVYWSICFKYRLIPFTFIWMGILHRYPGQHCQAQPQTCNLTHLFGHTLTDFEKCATIRHYIEAEWHIYASVN